MATVHEISPEEMAAYREGAWRRREAEQRALAAREERAWELARQAAAELRQQFGVERAVRARSRQPTDQDLLVDAIAFNLHDCYSGLERVFTHIASDVDQSVPTGPDWHRELLRQMTVDLPGTRPPVLTAAVAADADEFLRFRHVVRHIYAFALDLEQVERLASRLSPTFRDVRAALLAHATLLEGLAHEGE